VKQFKNAIFGALRTAVAFGLLYYLSASGAIDWTSILKLTANWPLILAALLVLLTALIVQSQRLCVLMKPLGMYLSLYSAVKLNLMGLFFNFCLPGATGGDAIKIYYALEGNKGRRTEVATLMLFDRAVGMFGLLMLPLLVTPLLPNFRDSMVRFSGLLITAAVVATGMLLAVLICLTSRIRNSAFTAKIFDKLPLGHYAKRIFDAIHEFRTNPSSLPTAVGLSLLTHCTTVGGLMLLARATEFSGSIWDISVLAPLGLVANALPVTPGGLGVGEAAFNRLFLIAGITGGADLLIGWRLLMIVLGIIGLAFYLQGRKRFILDSIPAS
jgi:uncharacterized protein (TIRG00374 family)